MDGSLSGSGDRQPRRHCRRECAGEGEEGSADDGGGGGDDLDKSENVANLVQKDAPRRTLSSELESSLVIGDRNWKNLDTVHKPKFSASNFEDSGSDLMDDSFAGSSFASTQDSFSAEEAESAKSQFTKLEDDTPTASATIKAGGNPAPRRVTPRRTYSKQRKQMPKKSDPLMAISETDNDSASIDS